MKEFEETSIEGWMIYPPENTPRVRRWIKTVDAMFSPARLLPLAGGETGREGKTKNALDAGDASTADGENIFI